MIAKTRKKNYHDIQAVEYVQQMWLLNWTNLLYIANHVLSITNEEQNEKKASFDLKI